MKKGIQRLKESLTYYKYNRSMEDRLLDILLIIMIACAIATIINIGITKVDSDILHTVTVKVPANKGTEIVYLDTEVQPVNGVLEIKLLDIDVETVEEIYLRIESKNKNITPMYYKVDLQTNNTLYIVTAPFGYRIGVLLNENIDTDVDVELEISNIYKPKTT